MMLFVGDAIISHSLRDNSTRFIYLFWSFFFHRSTLDKQWRGRNRERVKEVLLFHLIFLPPTLLPLLTLLLFLRIPPPPPVHVSTRRTCLSLAYVGDHHVHCPTEECLVPCGAEASAEPRPRRQHRQSNSFSFTFTYALALDLFFVRAPRWLP